mmetsp:Transcript_14157/g.36676  ORF Transcript_14157/g.36676 Transcript_14157/m.36676 type:complete len:230 (-) Transcript_14157:94-783(-)
MDLAPAASELAAVWKSVRAFLENIEGVKRITFSERAGASASAISSWEHANHPAKLPEDLSAFLQLSDGMQLTWALDYMGEEMPLGCMHLNDIRKMQRVNIIEADIGPMPSERITGAPRSGNAAQVSRERLPILAFDLDSQVMDGQLCLFFRPPNYAEPQVWFRDLSRKWHFVAHSFTDYFRLMIMHVGLARWQYAFTDVGLDPATKHWLRLFAPNRLALDADHHRLLHN